MHRLEFASLNLPVLSKSDVIVIGGSFAGIAAALELARAGLSVTLVEPRTYLGREITATHRYWLNTDGRPEADLHELIRGCIQVSEVRQSGSEVPLHPDNVKVFLEEVLLSENVKLLYASTPVCMLQNDGRVTGTIIANKSGLQLLEGRIVVDATETVIAARLLDIPFGDDSQELSRFGRVLEFEGVETLAGPETGTLAVSSEIGIAGNVVKLHAGCRGSGHVLVEFQLELPGENSFQGTQKREIEARSRSLSLASYLIQTVSAFHKAFLAASAHELYGPLTKNDLSIKDVSTSEEVERRESQSPIQGLWFVASNWQLSTWLCGSDPELSAAAGSRLAQGILKSEVLENLNHQVQTDFQYTAFAGSRNPADTSYSYEVKLQDSPQKGKPYKRKYVSAFSIPIYSEVDVLVAGGGTSGATAAITAAKEGMRTLLIEFNSGLGGTGTLGGVDSYWFGRRIGFAQKNTDLVEKIHRMLNYKGHKWNIEAKMFALLHEAVVKGADLLFNSILFGTVMDKNHVKGAVVATRFGPLAVLSEILLDATGDGDVASFAGAEFIYGSERDHTVMWYSLAQFERPGRTRNNFTSMVDVSNIEDYTRAILNGRRRGNGSHDHGVYVATRESRHIVGDVVMKLTDQMLHRSWPDVINIHFSNHDVKGVSGADWVHIGCIPPNLEIEIPYRMLLPKGLEGILVVGKAISATHDALPAIRMQADLENIGGVAALAAAQAIREGVPPRYADMTRLQQRLVDEGILPADVLTRNLQSLVYSDNELQELVKSLTADQPLYHYGNMPMNQVFKQRIPLVEVCTAGHRAVPFLIEEMYASTGRRQVLLAQVLSMLEQKEGVPILIAEIERMLGEGKDLPLRNDDFLYVQLPPDHGAMPDVAYLLYSLGIAKDERCLPLFKKIVERLDAAETDFKDMLKGTFYYVHSVCLGAERLGMPNAVPILEKLHNFPTLRDLICRNGIQPDYFIERRSMLELSIARALARCGSEKGYSILIAYLEDVRALLAEHAHEELRSISGMDFGKDPAQWFEWLILNKDHLEPRPILERLDLEYESEFLLRNFGSQ